MNLHDLGWSDQLESEFEPHAAAGLVPARVAVEHRGAYDVYAADGEQRAEVAPRFRSAARRRADFPAVGDWVALGGGLIHTVLPRRTKFSRKVAWTEVDEQIVAANVDVVFLVTAFGHDFNPRRLERYLVMAWESGAEPVIVLTKSDLADDVAGPVLEAESVAFGVDVVGAAVLHGDARGDEAGRRVRFELRFELVRPAQVVQVQEGYLRSSVSR